MTGLRQLIFFAFLLTTFSSILFCNTKAQLDAVEMYIVNPLTGDNVFNVTNYPIGSVFTVEFYVGKVTGMTTWQIHLKYNRTLINYVQAWFPDDNVFKQTIDQGAIPMKEISVNVDNATETADLFILMTCTYPPDSSQKYTVDVTSRELLCKTNFTITIHPISERLEFISEEINYSSLHVTPHYYLDGFRTSVDTLNGIYVADGEPAFFCDMTEIPEFPSFLILTLFIVAATSTIIAYSARFRLTRTFRTIHRTPARARK